ncbi:MAG: GAF domain-containing protein [Nitrospirota bacterium]
MNPIFKRRGFARKIVFSVFIVGFLSLFLGVSFTYLKGRSELRKALGADFEGLAKQAAGKISLMMKLEITGTLQLTNSSDIIKFLISENSVYEGLSDAEIKEHLKTNGNLWREDDRFRDKILKNDISSYIREFIKIEGEEDIHNSFFITDNKGALITSGNEYPEYFHGGEDWWKKTYYSKSKKDIFISNFYFNERINDFTFFIAMPILDDKKEKIIGVLRMDYRKHFFEPAIYDIKFGITGHAMLIDSEGQILICPLLPTGSHVTDLNLVDSVSRESPGWVVTANDAHGGSDSIIGFAPINDMNNIISRSIGRTWHAFIRQDPAETYMPINNLLYDVIKYGMILVGIMVFFGLIVSKRLIKPIETLREGVVLIGKGELDHTIDIKTNDEIEELAEEFNRMAEKLKESYVYILEQQVAARTKELSALNVIATTVNQSLDLQIILENTLNKIMEVLDIDGGAVRVWNDEKEKLVLRAYRGISNSAADSVMELNWGEELAGEAAKSNKPILIYDTKKDVNLNKNIFIKEGYRSIAYVPITSRNQVVGVLNVASLNPRSFSEKDSQLLSSIGSQMGTAIENAKLFEKSEKLAVLEEREWISREIHDGIAQDMAYLNMQIKILEDSFTVYPMEQSIKEIKRIRNFVKGVSDDIRELLGDFRTKLEADHGLIPALKKYIESFGYEHNIKINFIVENKDKNEIKFSPRAEVHILRVIQEGLSNIRKHAKADMVKIEMRVESNIAKINIKDNGIGFDINKAKSKRGRHLGLEIMKERINKLGGEFKITADRGRGTRLTIIIPLEGKNE